MWLKVQKNDKQNSLRALGNCVGISHYFLKFYKPNNQMNRNKK